MIFFLVFRFYIMDYELQLAKEHSRANTDRIAKAIGSDPAEFKKLIDIFYNGKKPLPDRASWLLSTVNAKHPELLDPYLSKLLDDIKTYRSDTIKRNIAMVMSDHVIPKKMQGTLISVCFDLLLSSDEKVAVKVHALQTIANIAKDYPEIIPELKSVVEDQLPKSSAAFHARARMIMKKFK